MGRKRVVLQRMATRHGQEFVKHVVPAVVKPARTLWNQFIAFLFFSFAIIFGIRAARLALEFSRGPAPDDSGFMLRLIVAIACTVLMLGFGVSSLLRARKISRS